MRVAVAGYGNIGRAVIEAIDTAPDMEFAGLVRRDPTDVPAGLAPDLVVADVDDLPARPDVVILTTPSRLVPEAAAEYLARGYNTADSYDIHTGIVDLLAHTRPVAEEHGTVAIHAAGWDPGSDSVVRALLEAAAPRGITYTNFGPGMSMGHTVAVKAIDGVADALSMTIPVGTSIHRRLVYVELEEGADFETVERSIMEDAYFVNDETHVTAVEDIASIIDTGHGVQMIRKGASGAHANQRFEFNMSIDNPSLTGQMLVSSARAAMRQQPGAYTLVEIPMIDLLPGEKDELISQLV